jgi:hypothetical protein
LRPVVWTLPCPGRSTFIPAGCLHWPIGEKDLLQKWVDAVAKSENGWTLLMGDSMDSARTHYRDHVRSYRQDQNSQESLDEYHKEDVRKLAKVLEPIKGKIAGAILGNHYWEYLDGTNSEQYLCQLLGIRYLGPTGILRLEFRDHTKRKDIRHHMVLYAHHSGGSAGGRTAGGDVNSLHRAETAFDADIYCLSHTHRRYAHREPVLGLTRKGEPRLVERPKVFIRTGAFLKGYREDFPNTTQPHFPTYAEQKAYRPTDLGYVTCTIDLHQAKRGDERKGESTSGSIRPEITVSF